MKHSSAWFTLILIALALCLSAARNEAGPNDEQKNNQAKVESENAHGASILPHDDQNQHDAHAQTGTKNTYNYNGDFNYVVPPDAHPYWSLAAKVGTAISAVLTLAIILVAIWGGRIAARTLDAIKRQADIAEQAITDIERPWMVILPLNYEVSSTHTITFRWIAKNVGRSPAWLTGGRGQAQKILATNLPPIPNYTEEVNYALTPHPPNEEGLKDKVIVSFDQAEYAALWNGQLDLIVRGVVWYKGIGDRKHETRFCIGIRHEAQGLAMSFCGPADYNRFT